MLVTESTDLRRITVGDDFIAVDDIFAGVGGIGVRVGCGVIEGIYTRNVSSFCVSKLLDPDCVNLCTLNL